MIDRLLSLLVSPLSLGIGFALVAFGASFLRGRALVRGAILVATLLLWIAAMPLTASVLVRQLERGYEPVSIGDAAPVDVVVLLGGGIAQPRAGDNAQLGVTGDRLFQTYFLWRQQKARVIVVSGGNQAGEGAFEAEADVATRALGELGVPAAAIVVENESRNTRENAVNVAQLWKEHGWQSGFLVTSATHMRRAEAVFVNVGLTLAPWPADYKGVAPQAWSVFGVLPDARALATTTAALKELLGMVVYRLRGWA